MSSQKARGWGAGGSQGKEVRPTPKHNIMKFQTSRDEEMSLKLPERWWRQHLLKKGKRRNQNGVRLQNGSHGKVTGQGFQNRGQRISELGLRHDITLRAILRHAWSQIIDPHVPFLGKLLESLVPHDKGRN